MRRLVFWMVLVGCESALPRPGFVAHGVLLASVAPEEDWIATIASPSQWDLRNLPFESDGELAVRPISATGVGMAIPVDVDVKWSRGFIARYLIYGVDHTHSLGSAFMPMVWNPDFPNPVALVNDPIVSLSAVDSIVYAHGVQGELSTLRLSDCDNSGCHPIALGKASLDWVGNGGTQCVFQTVVEDGVDFFYFDYTRGSPLPLGHVSEADLLSTDANSELLIGLSRDGSRLAFAAPGGGLRVLSTVDFSEVPWAPLPDKASLQALVFADSDRLFLKLGQGGIPFLYDSSPAMMRQVAAADHFDIVNDGPGPRPIAFIRSEDPLTFDWSLSAVDFASHAMHGLSPNAVEFPRLSSDGAFAFFIDDLDVETGEGRLKMLDLSALFVPGRSAISPIGVSNLGGQSFVPSADDLVYYARPSTCGAQAAPHEPWSRAALQASSLQSHESSISI
jgi:hypothetical protein